MKIVTDLSSPPIVRIERTNREPFVHNDGGFLSLEVSEIEFHHQDGTTMTAETNRIKRDRSDAVVLLLWEWEQEINDYIVWLRSSIRPAVALMDYDAYQLSDNHREGCFWELPAGLVEKDELGVDGLISAGVRECREEVGFEISPKDITFLGKRIFSCVGLGGERLFFLKARTSSKNRKDPQGDGSAYEYGGEVIAVPLKVAVAAIDEGLLPDAKTQIGIERLSRWLKKLDINWR